jgi:hypothetical protein
MMIYLIERETKVLHPLVEGEDPSCSPDGVHIAWCIPGRGGAEGKLMVGRLLKSGSTWTVVERRLVGKASAYSWSPDGRYLTYAWGEPLRGPFGLGGDKQAIWRLEDGKRWGVFDPPCGTFFEWVRWNPNAVLPAEKEPANAR